MNLHKSIFYPITFVLMILCTTLWAQRTPFTPFYRYNWQTVNPAAIDRIFMVDNDKTLMVGANYHKQWLGVEGAPEVYHVSFEHKPVVDRFFPHPIKWGLQAFGDKTDAIGTVGLYGNFSYYLTLQNSRDRTLHFGISPGVIQYSVDVDKTRFKEADDPLAGSFESSKFYGDISFGVFYRDGNRFYLGASVPQTFTLNINDENEDLFVSERIKKMHLYFVIGGFLSSSDRTYRNYYQQNSFVFEPSLWIRYVPGLTFQTISENIPFSGNMSMRVHYRNRMWGSLGYGTDKNLHFEFGVYKPIVFTHNHSGELLRIGISYDAPMGSRDLTLGHSLGINIGFAWN